MSNLTVNAINGVDVQNIAKQTARAWVNFNGTGVVAIRKAYNVASVTDFGVGIYGVNFTVPLPDANYVPAGMAGGSGSGGYVRLPDVYTPTTTAGGVNTIASNNTLGDHANVNVVFFD